GGRIDVDEVFAVAGHYLRADIVVRSGQQAIECVFQAEADDMAYRMVGRNSQPRLFRRSLKATNDLRRRIHQRTVPIEDDQIITMVFHEAVPRRSSVRGARETPCRL